MTSTEQATHPYDAVRRSPDAQESRHVDWEEAAGENFDGWRSAECVDVEGDDAGDGRTYSVVVEGVHGPMVRIRVDTDGEGGDVERGEWFTADQLDERIEDNGGEDGGYVGEYVERLRMARSVLSEDVDSAEGPMMNSFWLVESGGFGGRDVDIAEWAARLDGLPLCAVELDGDYGLALTGGGMDLSWEIAEGFLRIGYLPPSSLRLQAMADEGRDSRTGLDERHAAIVRAWARAQRGVVRNALYAVERMTETYGVDLSEEALDGRS